MGTRDTYQKTLLKACIVSVDETAVANKLGVPVGTVACWLLGDTPMPTEMFLRVVDIVLASTRQHGVDTRALLDRIKEHRKP